MWYAKGDKKLIVAVELLLYVIMGKIKQKKTLHSDWFVQQALQYLCDIEYASIIMNCIQYIETSLQTKQITHFIKLIS